MLSALFASLKQFASSVRVTLFHLACAGNMGSAGAELAFRVPHGPPVWQLQMPCRLQAVSRYGHARNSSKTCHSCQTGWQMQMLFPLAASHASWHCVCLQEVHLAELFIPASVAEQL
jgi:hypothetical protein